MTRVYVAGPMSGHPDLNIPLFNRVSAALRAAGYEVMNPAEINAEADAAFQALPAHEQALQKPGVWLACMRRDIAALVTCDAVVMLPGWGASRGARLEHTIAVGLGLLIMRADDMVPEAVHGKAA